MRIVHCGAPMPCTAVSSLGQGKLKLMSAYQYAQTMRSLSEISIQFSVFTSVFCIIYMYFFACGANFSISFEVWIQVFDLNIPFACQFSISVFPLHTNLSSASPILILPSRTSFGFQYLRDTEIQDWYAKRILKSRTGTRTGH